MRKTVVFAIALVLLLAFSGAVIAGDVGITINDEEVWLGVPPLVQDSQTIVPVRPLLELLNVQVVWDNESKLALGILGDTEIIFVTDETDLKEGEYENAVEIPTLKIQNRTFAPLRPTVESLGCFVQWDDLTKTIAISSGNENVPVMIENQSEFFLDQPKEKIDINSATFWELLVLQGIEENIARGIISYREENGPFMCFDELTKVDGVSDSIRKALEQNTRLVYYETGNATSYGGIFHGRRTASGEIFDKYAYTAAHPTLPFNTMVEVTFTRTGESVWVRINDRGPCQVRHPDRIIDLSRSSAYDIGLTRSIGVGDVELKIVKEN